MACNTQRVSSASFGFSIVRCNLRVWLMDPVDEAGPQGELSIDSTSDAVNVRHARPCGAGVRDSLCTEGRRLRFDHAAAEHDLPALLGLPRLRARVAVCDLYGIG